MNRGVSSLAAGTAAVARLTFTQDEVDDAKATLVRLTKATVIVRSPKRDEKTGRCEYVEVPDSGIQLAAAVKLLEFSTGKPKQTVDVQTGPDAAGKAQDLSQLVRKNPEILASMASMFAQLAQKAEAIPVQAVEANPQRAQGESESAGIQR